VNTCTTGERLHRRNAFTPEHQRHVFDRPATTTPSPHREHRDLSLLLPPLGFFLCWHPMYGDASLWNFLPVCWPSCRMIAVPRRMGAPGPVVPLSSAVAARRAMLARVD
jgi:hypothetical protein